MAWRRRASVAALVLILIAAIAALLYGRARAPVGDASTVAAVPPVQTSATFVDESSCADCHTSNGVRTRFFQRDGKYWINSDGVDGQPRTSK